MTGWRRSGRCDSGACVEATTADRWVLVRDSKLGAASPVLVFTTAVWAAFVDDLRGGRIGVAT